MYSKPTTAFESIIHSLAEAKADLNVRGVGGKTALMNASGFGFINVVKTLIELKVEQMMHIRLLAYFLTLKEGCSLDRHGDAHTG
mmetsp:Transcript_18586/g.26153  ORF Transcript_18586/g.26153 Transcript_18586/m.26153 type:complete len:85 (-) Transcript_18586:240-494(-)